MDDLGPGQKPIVMPSYPHMLAKDVRVWTRFLETSRSELKRVWYDVHVGEPVMVGGGPGSLEGRIAAGITRKRIDVVAQVGGGYWVIEVKPLANMLAVGQIKTYSRLFAVTYQLVGEVWAMIVCDEYDVDIVEDCLELGVVLIQN